MIGAKSPETELISSRLLFIHSHRRSGTHFLIDTIRTWFDISKEVSVLEQLPESKLSVPSASFKWLLIKDHEPCWRFKLGQKHIWVTHDQMLRCSSLYDEGKHIYILRNPLDVLRSAYIFDLCGAEPKFKIDPKTTFSEYLLGESFHEKGNGLTRIEYWSKHVSEWILAEKALILDFDELSKSTTLTLNRISAHLELPLRASPRIVEPTGVATMLTREYLAKGKAPMWDSLTRDIVRNTIASMFSSEMRNKLPSWAHS